jgi:hypothetical protein
MGKKSGPKAPAAPDPVQTAQAQAGLNKDSAITQANLNRIDQYTPQGSLTYSQNGTNADGTPRWSQTQTLSADEQAKYDLGNRAAIAMSKLANDNVANVQNAQSKAFSYDGMTPLQTSIGGGNPYSISSGPTGSYGVQNSIGNEGGDIQDRLDYSNLSRLPGIDDFSGDARRVADSVYGQATSRLDPAFSQREDDTRSRLAAQGISENSDAYRREIGNFNRDRNDAYNDAAYRAQQAGGNEQSRIFGMAMGARQQGQNEVNTQGAFRNAAQDQRQARALSIADLFNSANNQKFAQDQSAAAFNNNAQNQYFNQSAANATFNNSARQQEINEAAYLRSMPINEMAALLSGNQVNSPEFQQVAQVGVAAPDYAGLKTNQYNAQMNQYNQSQANRSQALGSIFGAAGGLGSAAILASDRRVKWDIKPIGVLANGIATYAFKYLGSRAQQFGVMAQEVFKVLPEAVVMVGELMFVDYAKVYNATATR